MPGPPARVPTPAPIKRPSPSAPFHPPSDTSTYRDLLLFEERLKMNAEMLRRRRRRYSVFLYTFMSAFGLMAYRLVVLPPSNWAAFRALQAAVAVVFITLALFFASGMYEEKIRYAHSYINHSNKALRPLNMYLNVRRAPTTLFSILSYLPLPKALRPSPPPMKAQPGPGGKGRPSTGPPATVSGRRVSHGSATVMAQIPPSSNPRGELIFSSRVDHHFEEGYKRYRAAFERRRDERAREDARAAGGWWALIMRGGRKAPPPPIKVERPRSFDGSSALASGPTPPGSRLGTPPPGSHIRRRSSASASGVSPPPTPRRSRRERERSVSPEPGRERAESYSFADKVGVAEAVSAGARS